MRTEVGMKHCRRRWLILSVLGLSVTFCSENRAPARSKFGEIEGRVVGDNGLPFEHVYVLAMSSPGKPVVSRWATTDTTGRYRIRGLPEGPYDVAVHDSREKRPSMNTGSTLLEWLGNYSRVMLSNQGSDDEKPVRVEVRAEKRTVQDFVRRRGITVLGQIVRSGSPPRQYGPVSRASVELVPIDDQGRSGWHREQTVETDEHGKFRIARVTPGRYAIKCIVGRARYYCGECRIGTEPQQQTVRAELGSGVLRVRVVSGPGTPVDEFKLRVRHASRPRVSVEMGRRRVRGGVLDVLHLHPGDHDVFVHAGGASVKTRARVRPDEILEVTVRMPSMGTVVILATDVAGNPVSDVNVLIQHPSGTPSYFLQSDEAGELRLQLKSERWLVGLPEGGSPLAGFSGSPTEVVLEPNKEKKVVVMASPDR